MGCAPEPNYHGRQLIRGLKTLREGAYLTQTEASEQLNMTMQKLSRLENGQLPGYHELLAMLDLYGLASTDWDRYADLWELAKKPGWWREYSPKDPRYVRMESEASALYEFQLGFVPELLQTERYALGTFVSGKEVALRMRRQDRLTADPPLRVHTIVHEPVLSQGVDRAQLVRLSQLAQLPDVTLQILPQARLHPGLRGSLSLLSFDDPHEPDIAFAETALGLSDSQHPDRTVHVRRILDQLAAIALSPEESIRRLAGQRLSAAVGSPAVGSPAG